MALMFMDGFDHYNIADIGKKWGTSVYGSGSNRSMDSGRINGQSLKHTNTESNGTVITKPFTSLTGGIGFAIKVSAYVTNIIDIPSRILVGLSDANQNSTACQCFLTLNSDGSLSVWSVTYIGTSTPTYPALLTTGGSIPLNTWTYVEWKWVMNDSGTVNVRVNGVETMSFSGDTRPNTFTPTSISLLGGVGFTAGLYGSVWQSATYQTKAYHYRSVGSLWLDDVYMFDASTGITDFLGDITVQTRLVTANGTTNQGTASAGSNYQCVDEALADTADYVTLDAVNEIETYVVENVTAGSVIKGVQVTGLVQKVDDGSAGLVSEIRHSGTNYAHPTAQGINTSYEFKSFVHEQDPLGADWTDTTFNAAEFGIKKSA